MTNAIVDVFFGSTLTSSGPVATDVSQHVDLIRGIEINRGAQDELSEIQPSSCRIPLDNSDGRFTPARAASPYYPNVKKGVPIRVSVATYTPRTGSAPYPAAMLSDDFDDNRISTTLWPNSYGGVTETGGRARVPLTPGVSAGYLTAREWTLPGSQLTARLVTVPAANGSSSAAAGIYVNSTTSGTRLGWRYNALTGNLSAENQTSFFDGSAVSLTYSPFSHAWLRIRETAGTVFWETSSDGASWTVRRSLATPAWVTSQTLTVEMPSARTGGTGDYIEWDYVGATVHPRFFGTVQNWPTTWKGLASTAAITCTDLLTWSSIVKELQSMLVQEVLLDRPTVFFPLTEPADSSSAGNISGTAGVGSLSLVQAGSGGTLEFAGGMGPNGQPCPVFTPASSSAGKYLSADLGPGFTDANASFRIRAECWFSTSTKDRVLLAMTSSDAETKMVISLNSGTGGLQVQVQSPGSGLVATLWGTPDLADGQLHHLVYNEFTGEVAVDGVTYSASNFSPNDQRLLYIGGFQNTRLWNGLISHVALYVRSVTTADLTPHYTTGTTGHAGESASARMSRLASYAGLAVTAQGSAFDAVASQADLGRSALEHMRDIARTESGKLLTNRSSGIPLIFQSRDLRYNPVAALTLEYADLETDGVEYAYDDQKVINAVTASRPGGATQRVISQASIDAYGEKPQPLDLLKNTDNAAADAANWVISRYADPPPEVRQVPIEAYSMPVATYRALLDADVSTVLSLTVLPDQAPASTATVVVEGYTENIGLRQHKLDFHTSRADTDTVWVLDDSTYSVLGSTTRLAY
ncbi:LamG-like jellyroll fold domain-containing protein [Streptomyces coerulescens]|uniref:LamG-like jellyroll fold domain-containing protein n=1 Tax=Streptomyces coerulescens TaxID=29304 RepID=A0ABW0CPQ2_STRCD